MSSPTAQMKQCEYRYVRMSEMLMLHVCMCMGTGMYVRWLDTVENKSLSHVRDAYMGMAL